MKSLANLIRQSRWILISVTIVALIAWDMATTRNNTISTGVFVADSVFHPKTNGVKVAIVGSDYSGLSSPTALTNTLNYAQIEDMVKKSLDLIGGISKYVKPGDTVLLKPNIVGANASGLGENTDVRVVKALMRIIHTAMNGNVKLIIGEGTPRPMPYEKMYTSSSVSWTKLWDKAGYPDLFNDPDLAGISFDTVNLNGTPWNNMWQDLVEAPVPGGGTATRQGGKYWVHKLVLSADVYIDIPVLKIHDPGITCALKNQIGIAACSKYGYSKTAGVPQLSNAVKLDHQNLFPTLYQYWTEEEIVDLSSIARIDLVVVDATMCLQTSKTYAGTNQIRFNTIVAGVDPVAVDNVCTRMFCMNPDDIGHITLAEKVGLGTNNTDSITIVGSTLASVKQRTKKNTTIYGAYGQGNRTWILSKKFTGTNISTQYIANEAKLRPDSVQAQWSVPYYFFDDRIDLNSFYGSPTNVIVYAFTYFDSPTAGAKEFWIGSDDAMYIYVNDSLSYTYTSTRQFPDIYSVKVNIPVKKGKNTLLVKALQLLNRFDFSVNICEPETDPIYNVADYFGNRVDGLKFYLSKTSSSTTPTTPGTTTKYSVDIVVDPANGGIVDGKPATTVDAASTIQLKATANAGYRLKAWIIGTDTLSKESTLNYVVKSNVVIVAKFEKITSLGIDALAAKVKIYPTIVKDLLNISGNNLVSFSIHDLQGRLIMKQQIRSVHTVVPVSAWKEGMYIITIQKTIGTLTQRIQVVK